MAMTANGPASGAPAVRKGPVGPITVPAGSTPDIAGLPAIIWEADAVANRMTYVSPRAKDILGYEPSQWLRTPEFWEDHLHPEDRRSAITAADRAIAAPGPVRVQYRFQDSEGAWRWFQDSIQVVKDGHGGRRLAGVMIDITKEHDALAALAAARDAAAADAANGGPASSRLHETIISEMSAGVAYVDTDRRISYWNRAAERLTGLGADEILGRFCHTRRICYSDAQGESICATDCPLTSTMTTGRSREMVAWMRRSDGVRFPVEIMTVPITSGSGSVTVGVAQFFTDATELVRTREAAEVARRDALWDSLTGLPNRGVLDIVVTSRLGDLNRYDRPFGMLIVAVEQIEVIRQKFGRSTHDETLRQAAGVVAKAIRGGDTLVKWGPDSFAIIAINTDAVGLRRLADRLLRLLASKPARVNGVIVPVRTAVGGTMAHKGEGADRFTGRAEEAMRTALAAGNGRFVLLDPSSANGPRMLGQRNA